jgi:sugar lactone lactonase YvrE
MTYANRRALCAAVLALVMAAPLGAGSSAAWESNTYADFIKGKFTGLSLTRDGRLTLAPKMDALFASGEAGVWCLAAAPDGSLYAGTGHRGRVYRIAADGKSSLVWNAPQPEVFAIAVDAKGRVYAATSPDGRVYRIEGGKASEWFNPKAKYIWAIALAKDGSVFVATGDQGKIYRVNEAGQGEVWYETGQTHVTALALDKDGKLLAGTEPNGILYRIDAKDKAFALYDSSLPEIRTIVPQADGSIFVAALGGGVAQKQAQAAATAAATFQGGAMVSSSITVTADAAVQQGGLDVKPKADAAKPAAADAAAAMAGIVEVSGVEKAAIIQIAPDHTSESLWSSKEENVFDMIVENGEVTFSTDVRGRIYRLSKELKSTLLVETREEEATRLAKLGKDLIAATADQGKVFRLSAGAGDSGVYESAVHDAKNVAKWGRVEWRVEGEPGQVSFRTRSGNAARPDQTWSAWSDPVNDPAKAAVASPNARYVQWQAELRSKNGKAPVLEAVAVTYMPQNTRPTVRSVQVTPLWVASPSAKTGTGATPATTSFSITVTDSGDSGPQTSSGTPTQTVNRSGLQQVTITWQADDPEGDKLLYALYYRAEDEREWKLLKDELTDNTYNQEADVFADGRYFFRVVASDKPANAPGFAKEAELISPPVLIDQTAPRVRVGAAKASGGSAEIDVDADDAASPLRRAEYSVDGKPWQLIEAVDGITDGMAEKFRIQVKGLGPGEHVVVFRVYDAAGNAGLGKAVIR